MNQSILFRCDNFQHDPSLFSHQHRLPMQNVCMVEPQSVTRVMLMTWERRPSHQCTPLWTITSTPLPQHLLRQKGLRKSRGPYWVKGYTRECNDITLCTVYHPKRKYVISEMTNGKLDTKTIITLSLPRVIDIKFLLQPHQKYFITSIKDLAFHSLLRWKIDYTTNAYYLTYIKLGECTFLTWEWKG